MRIRLASNGPNGRRGRVNQRHRSRVGLESLEDRRLMANALFFPPALQFPSEDLRQPPIIRSQNGTLDATLNMVKAGFDSDPILYGGKSILSSRPDPNSPNNPNNPVYAMAYQVDAYGTTYAAQYPGPIFQLQPGDTMRFDVNNNLASHEEASDVVFDTNLHLHGLHVNPLSDGDNVLRQITPGEGMDATIPIPSDHTTGVNWYHVHRHGSTHEQVYGGLAGYIVVGDALDPWPEYKNTVTQVYMGLSEVNIKQDPNNGPYRLSNYLAPRSGANFWTGWQKTVNGQVNPIVRLRPGETQVWNLGSIGAFGGYNLAITDGDLQNPWNATLLVQDGNGVYVKPYSLSLAADPTRMQDLVAATLLMPGNRLSMAVTAPTTPGTYYLIDGWGGQDKPAVVNGQQQYYGLLTIIVEGEPVTTPTPVFNPVGGIDPVFSMKPDVERTFEFSIVPGATPAQNQFLINGQPFGQGVMPQVQVGTVEEWTLVNVTNQGASANHPFHIHQGNFVITEINGVPVDPNATPAPGSSSLGYITSRDVINIPVNGSVKIRFLVEDFPGKYVFHCHILKHEDLGMMSPVLAFGPAEGLRLPFGTEGGPAGATLLNGYGKQLETLRPFPASYTGPVSTASALGASQEIQAMALATERGASVVKVYVNGQSEPTTTIRAFAGARARGGVAVAMGDLDADGDVEVVAASRANGAATIRIFKVDGTLVRELVGVLPGRFPNGVNVAVGDVNGDNYDDVVVGAGRGREPMVTAIDGRWLATGADGPAALFTFMAGGGPRAGARVAVGYVAPGTLPSYLANIITTAEVGPMAGVVQVWNPADFLGGGTDHMTMSRRPSAMQNDPMLPPPVPMPLATYRPFGSGRRAVRLASNYQGRPGLPVVAAWRSPHEVAFTTFDTAGMSSTTIRRIRPS